MIAIVNVSSEDTPTRGSNQYEVRINSKIICTFEHDRQYEGLAQCLRDAADAVDNHVENRNDRIKKLLMDSGTLHRLFGK